MIIALRAIGERIVDDDTLCRQMLTTVEKQ